MRDARIEKELSGEPEREREQPACSLCRHQCASVPHIMAVTRTRSQTTHPSLSSSQGHVGADPAFNCCTGSTRSGRLVQTSALVAE